MLLLQKLYQKKKKETTEPLQHCCGIWFLIIQCFWKNQ